MATTREQLQQLQKEVRQLKIESAEVRRVLRARGILPAEGKRATVEEKRPVSQRERVREILRKAGLLGELSAEEKKMAAEWRALPEERKQEIIQRLQNIRLNPPLSETIIQDRG